MEVLDRHDTSLDEEGRFRLLVDAITDYAIYMLSPEGIVTSWNTGAQRFKGYRPSEILGEHFSRFYVEEDRAALQETVPKAFWRELREARLVDPAAPLPFGV